MELTKEQAITEMLNGKKITHRYFSSNEYIFMKLNDSKIYSEDGVCHGYNFWGHRQGDGWRNGYSIFLK